MKYKYISIKRWIVMMYLDNIIDNPMDLNELKKLLNFENIKNKA